jgi:hypothetical protein
MKWLFAFLLLLLILLSNEASGRLPPLPACETCCPFDADLTISEVGAAMQTRGAVPGTGRSCNVRVFTRPRLHRALAGQWLFFLGDSSTRGLFLALYYELLDAKAELVGLKPPQHIHERVGVWKERSRRLFRFGDDASRAWCKSAFAAVGRPESAIRCDDYGDPCHIQASTRTTAAKIATDAAAVVDPKQFCRQLHGNTHSVASLHLGFLDAGFCDGKLEFVNVLPHDYREGGMDAVRQKCPGIALHCIALHCIALNE